MTGSPRLNTYTGYHIKSWHELMFATVRVNSRPRHHIDLGNDSAINDFYT